MRIPRRIAAVCATLVMAWLFLPSAASAQIQYGGHLVRASDAFDGAHGVGARVGIGLPLFPVEGFATAEYFFPDCGDASGCGLAGGSLDVNYRMPLIVVSPYATGGLTLRRLDPGNGAEAFTETGVHVGVGASAGVPGIRFFGEARYEFVGAPDDQVVIRLGLLLSG